MALPSIAPYPMPGAEELPGNRVEWTLNPARAALLIHDMQRHFVNAFDTSSEPVPELIANITALRDRCHTLGIPVIYSAQPHGQSRDQRGLLQDFWGDGISADPTHAEIIDALAPHEHDTMLTKWRYSAFVRTDLHDELRSRGRDQLMICGIYAHIGCLMTAAQAFMEEVQPFLVADAVADFSRLDHHMALDYASRRCAVTLTTTTAVEQLGSGSGVAAIGEANSEAEQTAGAVDQALDQLASGPLNGASSIRARRTSDVDLSHASMLAHVRAQLANLADEPLDEFADDDDLSDAGIDSIRLMGLIGEWQDAGFAVSFEELVEDPTIAAWAGLLQRRATTAS